VRCEFYGNKGNQAYLGERGALGDLLHAVDERAEVGGGNRRIADELHQVVDDDDRPALDLHPAVVQRAEHERDEHRERGRLDLHHERGRRQALDARRDRVRVRHALDERRDVRDEVRVLERRAERRRALDRRDGHLLLRVVHGALDGGEDAAELARDLVARGRDEGLHPVERGDLALPLALVEDVLEREEDEAGRLGREELQDRLRRGGRALADDVALVRVEVEDERQGRKEERRDGGAEGRGQRLESDYGTLSLVAGLLVRRKGVKCRENVMFAENRRQHRRTQGRQRAEITSETVVQPWRPRGQSFQRLLLHLKHGEVIRRRVMQNNVLARTWCSRCRLESLKQGGE
jgi:hypothetical protein